MAMYFLGQNQQELKRLMTDVINRFMFEWVDFKGNEQDMFIYLLLQLSGFSVPKPHSPEGTKDARSIMLVDCGLWESRDDLAHGSIVFVDGGTLENKSASGVVVDGVDRSDMFGMVTHCPRIHGTVKRWHPFGCITHIMNPSLRRNSKKEE